MLPKSKNVQNRFYEHRTLLRRGLHYNPHLQRAWNKYGEQVFLFRVLEGCLVEELDGRENFWIAELHVSERGVGYNMEEVARGTGPRSLETRRKISESKKGKVDPVKSAEHGRKGRGVKRPPRTEEHRAKLGRKGEASAQFGTCWIHRAGVNKKVPRSELENYKANDWLVGRIIPQHQKEAMLRGRGLR